MSLDLLVVRHAIAGPAGAGVRDAERELTHEGRQKMRRAVAGLARLELRLDRVLHSPWRRAAQTAELLAPLLADGGELRACAQLAAEPGPGLLDALGGGRVAAVGHEPWVSELVAWLAFGRRDLGRGLEFRKGGVARLLGEPCPGGMTLLALWTPATLRALAGAD
jgi:phosphohistidine phosphatase